MSFANDHLNQQLVEMRASMEWTKMPPGFWLAAPDNEPAWRFGAGEFTYIPRQKTLPMTCAIPAWCSYDSWLICKSGHDTRAPIDLRLGNNYARIAWDRERGCWWVKLWQESPPENSGGVGVVRAPGIVTLLKRLFGK